MHIRSIMLLSIGLLLATTLVIPPMLLDNRGKEVQGTDQQVRQLSNDTRVYSTFVRSGEYLYSILWELDQSIGRTNYFLRKTDLVQEEQWEIPLIRQEVRPSWQIVGTSADYVALVAFDTRAVVDLSGVSDKPVTFNMTVNPLVFSADTGQLLYNSTYTHSVPIFYDAIYQELTWVFFEGMIVGELLFIPYTSSNRIVGEMIDPLESSRNLNLMTIDMKTDETVINELMKLKTDLEFPSLPDFPYSFRLTVLEDPAKVLEISFLLSSRKFVSDELVKTYQFRKVIFDRDRQTIDNSTEFEQTCFSLCDFFPSGEEFVRIVEIPDESGGSDWQITPYGRDGSNGNTYTINLNDTFRFTNRFLIEDELILLGIFRINQSDGSFVPFLYWQKTDGPLVKLIPLADSEQSLFLSVRQIYRIDEERFGVVTIGSFGGRKTVIYQLTIPHLRILSLVDYGLSYGLPSLFALVSITIMVLRRPRLRKIVSAETYPEYKDERS